MTTALPPSSFQRLTSAFDGAFRALGMQASGRQIEAWAMLVHEAMSGRGREFHTVQHVFDVSSDAEADPIAMLAALFHDTVYWQVDGGLHAQQHACLADAVREPAPGEFVLTDVDGQHEPLRALLMAVFGFASGQTVSLYGGLNEYLSALLAARALEQALPPSALAEVAACIEGTIPFREPGESGEGPANALAERLTAANERFRLGLTAEGVDAAVHRAVRVANRDVSSFAHEDPAVFIDNTWKLLPETNHSLRGQRLYLVSEYRIALTKMEAFLSQLDTRRVFRSYRGVPGRSALADLHRRCTANVALGIRYLQAKLYATAVLEALVMRTGGDAPIAMFMGDLLDEGRRRRLEDLLPPAPRRGEGLDDHVLEILSHGRAHEISFDLRTSPLAAFLYECEGPVAVERGLAIAQRGWRGEDGAWPERLLEQLDPRVSNAVARACAELAPTRRGELLALGAR